MPILSELMKLGNQFEKIIGGLNVDWHGATETIPQARLHWQSQDRAEREKSWRLVMAAYLAQREKLNDLYLQMLGKRRQVAKNAGQPHFRAYKWQELARFDYTPDDCATFHDAIEHEVVPLAKKIYAEQTDRLGLAALRPWDTDVDPHGEPLRPFKEVADLEEGCYRIFNQVDPELAATSPSCATASSTCPRA